MFILETLFWVALIVAAVAALVYIDFLRTDRKSVREQAEDAEVRAAQSANWLSNERVKSSILKGELASAEAELAQKTQALQDQQSVVDELHSKLESVRGHVNQLEAQIAGIRQAAAKEVYGEKPEGGWGE